MNNNTTNRKQPVNDDDIDLGKYFQMFAAHWYWFVLTLVMAIGLAWFVNTRFIKIYDIYATLLIEDDKQVPGGTNGNASAGTADIISGFGLFPSQKNLQNQILILSSQSQIEKTVRSLGYEVSYYKKELTGKRSILSETPFTVIPDKSSPQPVGVDFELRFTPDGRMILAAKEKSGNVEYFRYSDGESSRHGIFKEFEAEVRFGQQVKGENYSFTLQPGTGGSLRSSSENAETYCFSFNSYRNLVSYWSGRLKLTVMQKEASMVKLSIQDDCPEKAVMFLNAHCQGYLQRTLDKKNTTADKTIDFIENQLESITDSLKRTELNLQQFRMNNRVVDLSYQGQQLFQQGKELNEKFAELKLKEDYLKYLLNYLTESKDAGDIIAPSVMGITDPLLNDLVLSLNKMLDQIAILGGSGSKNPYAGVISSQITNAKEALEENTRSMMHNNEMSLKDIQTRITGLMNEVNKLPATERQLFSIERIFRLNDEIYTYLLQQRYTAQIARASNIADNEIIDKAIVAPAFVKPKPMMNYLIAIAAALFIPGLILVVIDLLNTKIISEEDVKLLTDLPITGHIMQDGSDNRLSVLADTRSDIAESFRSIRTRLNFFLKDVKSPVILVTSAMPQDGKTFTSINLASVCSLAGKMTILVGFDLRSPRLNNYFEIDNTKGLSTYLSGRDPLESIIQQTKYDNLWVMPSGPIPPNPAELISSSEAVNLLAKLRERFDFIIIDSAPVGIVADTFSIMSEADINIFVVRHRKTEKKALDMALKDAVSNGLPHLSLVINDINLNNTLYGRYGYGYGFRYGYGKGYARS